MGANIQQLLGCLLLFVVLIQSAYCKQSRVSVNRTDSHNSRAGKLFPVFQIITFHNDVCNSGSSGRNGTCYTAEECNTLGGSSSGSCAEGFGVCCIFSLSCGSTSSQNCTYLVQSSGASLSQNPCTYTICRCSTSICRIRFDFNTFSIANPEAGTTTGAVGSPQNVGASIGDCLTDQFSVTSPGNRGSPIICGLNSGQHLYVDASSTACHRATFSVSSSDSTTRSWDIKVTQYECGDTRAGPDGCLQYFTGATGTVSSFNFPSGTVTSAATHLSDQCYSICFRRESSYCAICFAPAITIDAAIDTENMQTSFGLSISTVGVAAATETACSTDYVVIRNAQDIDPANPLVIGTFPGTALAGRICGRAFSSVHGGTAVIVNANGNTRVSVCTQVTPFQIDVKFDEDEVAGAQAATTNEQDEPSGGIVGFSLNYAQVMC